MSAVPLERRKVVDLLAERSAESLARWLRQRPGVELATRDRSNVYARGISEGAPDAAQVADRWHLLHGLALGLEDFLLHKRSVLRAAAKPEESDAEPAPEPIAGGSAVTVDVPSKREYESIEEPSRKRHERLVEQREEIRRLHLAGARVNDIARWTGTSLRTVYRYRDLEQPPPRVRYKRRASVLDPYVPYLVRRWNEGCRSGKKLYGEIRKQGYSHSKATVNRLLSNLRYTESQGKRLSHVPRAKKGSIAGSSPTAKNVAALFMRREQRLSEGQRGYLERLCASDAALADARRLTQDFAKMARELEGGKLDEWLEEADGCEASVMRRFSASLKRDLSAVRSGLTEQWNNGPVEGFVHKLKLVKRQGYGRAGFELLRARMLAA